MPRSIKNAYTDKQKLGAEHVEQNIETRRLSKEQMELRSWAASKFEEYNRIKAVLNSRRNFGYKGL